MYNTSMDFLRKTVVVTVCSLLPMVLLSFGILFSLYQVFGSPTHIKKALDTSGIYDTAIASFVEQATNKQGTSDTQTSEGEAAVRKAVADAIPASYIKDQTNGVLDGIYAWVQGDTQNLAFSIDLTPVKTTLVDNLTAQALLRAQSLPTCTTEAQLTSTDDPFSMECLPPGTTPDTLANQTRQSVLDSEIFKNASITPADLTEKSDKPLDQQLSPVRDGYRGVKKSVYLTGLLAVIFIATAIFLSRPKQSGIKRVALILLTTGGVGIITAVVGNFVVKFVIDSLTEKAEGALGTKIAQAAQLLASDIRNWWLILGTLSVVAAIGTLVGIRVWNKKHATPAAGVDPKSPKDKTSSPTGPAPILS
jgi:hypothetical protein